MNRHENKAVRILIVDDHPVVQAGLASMLATHKDIEVIGSASSGEEALTMAQQDMPDIILLDLRMPGMSGIDTLRALKEAQTTARTIILPALKPTKTSI